MRIGFSKDIHVIKEGLPLVLGGVQIPCDFDRTVQTIKEINAQ